MMATRVGTLLGRYQIHAKIGRGAMGEVYCALDPKINRTVAIKTVSLEDLEPDAEREYRERFVLEAQAAGRLSHPGIITIFDVAEEPETGTPYLVMEYVEGKSLGQLLSGEDGGLPLRTALHLTQEVAEALHYAHAQGVVHRDIKPANILITADGHAEDRGLRHCEIESGPLDPAWPGAGKSRLHVPGAIERQRRGRAI